MEEDSYRNDEERLHIAQPVIKANRAVLHAVLPICGNLMLVESAVCVQHALFHALPAAPRCGDGGRRQRAATSQHR